MFSGCVLWDNGSNEWQQHYRWMGKKEEENVKKRMVLSTFDENICSSFSLSLCRFHFVFRFYSLFAAVVVVVIILVVDIRLCISVYHGKSNSFRFIYSFIGSFISNDSFLMVFYAIERFCCCFFLCFPFIHLGIALLSIFLCHIIGMCAAFHRIILHVFVAHYIPASLYTLINIDRHNPRNAETKKPKAKQ